MIYLSGKVSSSLFNLRPDLGFMMQPHKGNSLLGNHTCWAADTGCFQKPELFMWEVYILYLNKKVQETQQQPLFATAPDVLSDWRATHERSIPILRKLREEGFKAALVTQDGLTPENVPWNEIDYLFIGGTNEHKLGRETVLLCNAATQREVPVHMGRVNSWKRMQYAWGLGCESVDGSCLAFDQTNRLKELNRWLDRVNGRVAK